jgi:hypothetical protein
MASEMNTLALDDPRQYDCCAHVTKGGNRCGALRWYHDDPGRARHKFVEPKREYTDKEKVDIFAVLLREELAALRTWQHAILPYGVQDGIAISIDKIERALTEAGYATN